MNSRLRNILVQLVKADRRTLVWTNSSPGNNFGPQTVPLDLSGYDYVDVEFISSGDGPGTGHATPVRCGVGDTALSIQNSMIPTNMRWRWLKTLNTGVQFSDGYLNQTINNGYCKPYRIYGIKAGTSV